MSRRRVSHEPAEWDLIIWSPRVKGMVAAVAAALTAAGTIVGFVIGVNW